jgi:hypothetical protein
MKTREILPPEWKPFFDRFSRAHQGMRATVETLDLDLGVQPNARNLPLVGVAIEGGEDDRRIEVIVGESTRAHLTHVIDQPLRVRVAEGTTGSRRPSTSKPPTGGRRCCASGRRTACFRKA